MKNNNRKNIWVLEDNEGCIFVYNEILSDHYQVHIIESIADLFSSIQSMPKPDLLISDIILPDGRFMDYFAKYRQFHANVPIIFVSGLDDYETIRDSFTVGVQDYLTKPFRSTELLAKVEKTLMLTDKKQLEKDSRGLGIDGKNVVVDGTTMDNLTTKQIQILSLFLQSKERIVGKDAIVKAVWGKTVVHPKALDVHIYHLRRKLEDYGLQIKSIGIGEWQLLSRYVQNKQPTL